MKLEFMRWILHYGGHFILPALIAYLFFKTQWKKAYLIMLVTMLIDLDHLLATPIYLADRCSINFHPLHTYWALGVYALLLGFKQTRILGIGLLLHLLIDGIDCLWLAN